MGNGTRGLGRWVSMSSFLFLLAMGLWVRSHFVKESFFQSSLDESANRIATTGVGWFDGQITFLYGQAFPGRKPVLRASDGGWIHSTTSGLVADHAGSGIFCSFLHQPRTGMPTGGWMEGWSFSVRIWLLAALAMISAVTLPRLKAARELSRAKQV